jgi:acetyl-CoA carboxylase biotin carboxyl carrier protein
MDLEDIKQILELMREHDLAEFELERDGGKLRLRKNLGPQWAGPVPPAGGPLAPAGYSAAVPGVGGAVAPGAGPAGAAALTSESEDVDLAIMKSPIVGTFYRSLEPGSKPFVDVGQRVKKGDVLCIIEAMKLMNEINAECDGEVIRVYVENGQAVQYGERLFAVKPS